MSAQRAETFTLLSSDGEQVAESISFADARLQAYAAAARIGADVHVYRTADVAFGRPVFTAPAERYIAG